MIYVDKTKEHEMCQIDPFKKESVCEQHPPPPKKKNPNRSKYNSNDISTSNILVYLNNITKISLSLIKKKSNI